MTRDTAHMPLDERALEAARDQPGTNHDGIIRAYLQTATADVSGLVERLDHSAAFAFPVVQEAASLIQSQAAESAADKARIEELEAALKPFAAEASEWSWKFADGQQVSSRPGPPHDEDETAKFTVGDLRTARRLLNGECKG